MIHYFNPGHEGAVLNASKYYMPPANVVNMQNELAYLLAWYADNNDFVVIKDELPSDFVTYLKENLDIHPKGITLNEIASEKENLLQQKVKLWGLSPQAIHLFETIDNEHKLGLSIPKWNDDYQKLCDRHTAQKCLQNIIENLNGISSDIVPQFFSSLEQIEEYVSCNKTVKLLAKAPFSSSGRGLLWLPLAELSRTERQILHGHLKKQGSVSIEKVLNKKLDFAMEFTSLNKAVKFEGVSLFQTNNKGAYTGNYLASQARINEVIAQHIDPFLIENVKSQIVLFLEKHVSHIYEGCIGVDMMIYDENGVNKLHPCLEINMRNNMGFVAMNISKNILKEGSEGHFHIDFDAGNESIYNKDMEMTKTHPPIFENNKIISGYLSLCPISKSSKYRAYILVRQIEQII